MCPKIDVMERECKKLEFRGELNSALAKTHVTKLPKVALFIFCQKRLKKS
jgi:hypothetical protein